MKYRCFLKNFNITKKNFNGLNRDDLLYAIYQQNFIIFNIIDEFIDFLGVQNENTRYHLYNSFYNNAHQIALDEMGCHYERYKKSYKFNKNCQISKIE